METDGFLHACSVGDVDRIREHLGRGQDVEGRDSAGRNGLHIAAQHGHVRIVSLLLSMGADPNAAVCPAPQKDPRESKGSRSRKESAPLSAGTTSLVIAAQRGDAEMVSVLLQNGADAEVSIGDGWTAFLAACVGGHIHVLERFPPALIARHVHRPHGALLLSPLHLAAHRQDPGLMRWLLAHGADPSSTDAHGWTPLAYVDLARQDLRAMLESDASFHVPPAHGSPDVSRIDPYAHHNQTHPEQSYQNHPPLHEEVATSASVVSLSARGSLVHNEPAVDWDREVEAEAQAAARLFPQTPMLQRPEDLERERNRTALMEARMALQRDAFQSWSSQRYENFAAYASRSAIVETPRDTAIQNVVHTESAAPKVYSQTTETRERAPYEKYEVTATSSAREFHVPHTPHFPVETPRSDSSAATGLDSALAQDHHNNQAIIARIQRRKTELQQNFESIGQSIHMGNYDSETTQKLASLQEQIQQLDTQQRRLESLYLRESRLSSNPSPQLDFTYGQTQVSILQKHATPQPEEYQPIQQIPSQQTLLEIEARLRTQLEQQIRSEIQSQIGPIILSQMQAQAHKQDYDLYHQQNQEPPVPLQVKSDPHVLSYSQHERHVQTPRNVSVNMIREPHMDTNSDETFQVAQAHLTSPPKSFQSSPPGTTKASRSIFRPPGRGFMPQESMYKPTVPASISESIPVMTAEYQSVQTPRGGPVSSNPLLPAPETPRNYWQSQLPASGGPNPPQTAFVHNHAIHHTQVDNVPSHATADVYQEVISPRTTHGLPETRYGLHRPTPAEGQFTSQYLSGSTQTALPVPPPNIVDGSLEMMSPRGVHNTGFTVGYTLVPQIPNQSHNPQQMTNQYIATHALSQTNNTQNQNVLPSGATQQFVHVTHPQTKTQTQYTQQIQPHPNANTHSRSVQYTAAPALTVQYQVHQAGVSQQQYQSVGAHQVVPSNEVMSRSTNQTTMPSHSHEGFISPAQTTNKTRQFQQAFYQTNHTSTTSAHVHHTEAGPRRTPIAASERGENHHTTSATRDWHATNTSESRAAGGLETEAAKRERRLLGLSLANDPRHEYYQELVQRNAPQISYASTSQIAQRENFPEKDIDLQPSTSRSLLTGDVQLTTSQGNRTPRNLHTNHQPSPAFITGRDNHAASKSKTIRDIALEKLQNLFSQGGETDTITTIPSRNDPTITNQVLELPQRNPALTPRRHAYTINPEIFIRNASTDNELPSTPRHNVMQPTEAREPHSLQTTLISQQADEIVQQASQSPDWARSTQRIGMSDDPKVPTLRESQTVSVVPFPHKDDPTSLAQPLSRSRTLSSSMQERMTLFETKTAPRVLVTSQNRGEVFSS